MKITEEMSNESARFEEAKVAKGEAKNLFKLARYLEAGERFCQAAKILDGKRRLGGEEEELTLVCSCFSNASMSFLKGGDGERAGEAAKFCISEGKGGEVEAVASIVVKARFRRAQAMIMLAEGGGGGGGGAGEDVGLYLDEAQMELAAVLRVEPSNDQALELAQRGLQLSQELINVKTAVEDDAEEEQEQDFAKEEGNLANAALGAPSGPSAAWNMNYMVPGWLEEQKKKKEEEEKKAKEISEANKAASEIISSKAQGMSSVTSMVENLRAERRREKGGEEDEEKKISLATEKSWGTMGKEEESLNKNFNDLVKQRAEISAVAYDVGIKNVRTADSNYSDGWRSKHASRRYEGKEGKHKVSAGKSAWEELQGMEEGAVKIVEQTVERKKELADKKFLGEGAEVRAPPGGEDEDGEGGGGGGGVEWRKKLKQRRKGEEIKIKKKSDGGIGSEWESMLGLEEEEKARVDMLKEQRREAERLAERKKAKKVKKKNGAVGQKRGEGGEKMKKKKKAMAAEKKIGGMGDEERQLADILGSVQLGCAAIRGAEEEDEDGM